MKGINLTNQIREFNCIVVSFIISHLLCTVITSVWSNTLIFFFTCFCLFSKSKQSRCLRDCIFRRESEGGIFAWDFGSLREPEFGWKVRYRRTFTAFCSAQCIGAPLPCLISGFVLSSLRVLNLKYHKNFRPYGCSKIDWALSMASRCERTLWRKDWLVQVRFI